MMFVNLTLMQPLTRRLAVRLMAAISNLGFLHEKVEPTPFRLHFGTFIYELCGTDIKAGVLTSGMRTSTTALACRFLAVLARRCPRLVPDSLV